jgi:hypothetical protein
MFFSVWAGMFLGYASAMLRTGFPGGTPVDPISRIPLDFGWVLAGAGAAVALQVVLMVLMIREKEPPDVPSVFD